MDKGIIMWAIFLTVITAGMLISRRIKKGIKENGIEADAVVSRIIEDGTQTDIDTNVYVRYHAADGREIEAILSNPRSDLEEEQRVRIKYHPKYTMNARLIGDAMQ